MKDNSKGLAKGYVQVYTGNGKGKTTAALGLSLRAAGAGLKVLFAQFVKGRDCSEHAALKRFEDLIEVRQYGRPGFIRGNPSASDREDARRGFEELREALQSGDYSLVVLDEAGVALNYGLLSVEDVLELIGAKPEHVELVLTGRNMPPAILERAGVVTEMREIRHYFKQGVAARVGIEY